MFNLTAYSQDIITPRSQKNEILKGLISYDECKDALERVNVELDIEKKLNDGYKTENTELIKENAVYARDNKTLKSNTIVYKVLGFGLGVLGFYMGTQL